MLRYAQHKFWIECEGIITDGKDMDGLRVTRRGKLMLFRGHLSTLLPRPDVERQGYCYEVRSKRTKIRIAVRAYVSKNN
jgi:hypothetical protein